MKKSKTLRTLLAAATLLAVGATAFVLSKRPDRSEANEAAVELSVNYQEQGYDLGQRLVGKLSETQISPLTIPVKEGLDYVVFIGADKGANSIHLVINDQDGAPIATNTGERSARIEFTAQHTGFVTGHIAMKEACHKSFFCLQSGKRDAVGVEAIASR